MVWLLQSGEMSLVKYTTFMLKSLITNHTHSDSNGVHSSWIVSLNMLKPFSLPKL